MIDRSLTTRSTRGRPAPAPLAGEPRASSRLADDLTERIRELIVGENIAEGARLPSERDLAERFGASRPTVSQALRSLSLMGLVEIRRGSGAYVVRRPESIVAASVNLMLDLDEHSVDDLMRLRLWLETVGVREAATRLPELTADEKAEMFHRLGAAVGNASEWISADTVFHATLVRAAGNPYLTAVYEGVHTAVLSYEHRQWVQHESVPEWLRHTTPDQHLELHAPILDAVLARDPDAATRAVTAHHRIMVEHMRAAKTPGGHREGSLPAGVRPPSADQHIRDICRQQAPPPRPRPHRNLRRPRLPGPGRPRRPRPHRPAPRRPHRPVQPRPQVPPPPQGKTSPRLENRAARARPHPLDPAKRPHPHHHTHRLRPPVGGSVKLTV